MRALAAALAAAGILAGGGCATEIRVDVDPQGDLSGFRTWDWLRPSFHEGTPAVAVDREIEAALRVAVERELRARGYERATLDAPDFLVAYRVTLERELVRRTETPAMQTLHSHHREGGFEVTASVRTVQTYETGTIVLVVVDGEHHQSLWRGTGVRRVRERFQPRADEVVTAIFERFPAASTAWF